MAYTCGKFGTQQPKVDSLTVEQLTSKGIQTRFEGIETTENNFTWLIYPVNRKLNPRGHETEFKEIDPP